MYVKDTTRLLDRERRLAGKIHCFSRAGFLAELGGLRLAR